MIENLKVLKTTRLNEQVKSQLLDLWNNEYPVNLSCGNLTEFDNYLLTLTNIEHYLLSDENDIILGWAYTFDRDNEKWFAIILSEMIKGKGLGRKMLDEIKKDQLILNGWVIDHNNDKKQNGQQYFSPLKFYQKCAFQILEDVRLELDKISAVKIRWTK